MVAEYLDKNYDRASITLFAFSPWYAHTKLVLLIFYNFDSFE